MNAADVAFEEDLQRNPYSFKNWWFYIEFKAAKSSPAELNVLFERALRQLPNSYKLWYAYLKRRVADTHGKRIDDPVFEQVNNCFQRALVHMHKMPRIWVMYLELLIRQKFITRVRKTFDEALRGLPITMHQQWIWGRYIKWAQRCGVKRTMIAVYRRFLKISHGKTEDFIQLLADQGAVEEAAMELTQFLDNPNMSSSSGKSRYDLWKQLVSLCTEHPDKVKHLDVEAVIRSGIKRFASEVGNLYNALAVYYVKQGVFGKARDVFEDGLAQAATVRDFSVIFDAYCAVEENILTSRMESFEKLQNSQDVDRSEAGYERDLHALQMEVDLRMARLEALMDRRPMLLNSVLLKQNPHNVTEWLNRTKLVQEDPVKVTQTFSEAVTTVDPRNPSLTGAFHVLWIKFAHFYETHDDLDNARVVYQKAVKVDFTYVDALASVYCAWAEMELRHKRYNRALRVLKEACVAPSRANDKRWKRKAELVNLPVQDRLFKSSRLWAFYADLEENLGTLETTKAVYNMMFELNIVTPQIVLNFAKLLEDHDYYEDSFRVYEKGVAAFQYPNVYPIWVTYLKRFLDRFGGKKIERARNLFNQAVSEVPGEKSKALYLMYAKFEEDYGLARRALDVYDRACEAVELADKAEMYSIYANRCAELFGVAKTREVFDKAMAAVRDEDVEGLCRKYAHVEKELGETDRARAVYMYGSQFVDPRTSPDYWQEWHGFELECGNADTYREMLRVKRSVRTAFSFRSQGADPEKVAKQVGGASHAKQANGDANSMEALELASIDRVEEERKAQEEADQLEARQLENPAEIDLDDLLEGDDDEDEEEAQQTNGNSSSTDVTNDDDFPTSSVPQTLFQTAN